MPTWPVTLPQAPLVNTLTIDREPNVVEFKSDVGRPQRSKRYTQSREPYSANMLMTDAQRVDLMDFFADDCAEGAVSFEMEDWADLGQSPATMALFTWATPPRVSWAAPGYWQVSLNVVKERLV